MPQNPEWDPFRELSNVQKRMNDLFESALDRTGFREPGEIGTWEPLADVIENDAGLEVCLELPGLNQSDIDVRVDGDELVIEGNREMSREQAGGRFHRVERSYGKFSRRFRLSSWIDRESVEAVYRDGVLRIRLTRKSGSEPRAIKVSVR